jgi:O-antigen/teichoic acid export membrane protein
MKKSGGPPGETLASSQPTLAERAVSGSAWIALEMGSTQLASLLVFAVMARFVTPADFGLISISYLAIYTVKSLVVDSIVVAVGRKTRPADLEYTTSFWLTLTVAAVGSLALLLSAPAAEQLMNAPGLKEALRAMSVILLFMGLARTHEMRLIRSFQFRQLALRNILGALLGGATGIVLAERGYGLGALIGQQITTSGISLGLLWAFSSWSPTFRASKRAILDIFGFIRSTAPANILGVVSQNSDTFLVAYFFGPAGAGAYAIAKRLRLALQLAAVTPISGVLFSTLAEVQDDRERLKNVSRRMIALLSLICAPIFVGASSIARETIDIAFGERWSAAGPILEVLTLGGFFAALQSFTDTVFVLKNRQIWSFYLLLIQTALVVLFFFPSKVLGPNYMAVPFVAPYVVTLPLSAILVSRLTGLSFSDWLIATVPSLVSAGVMFGAVKLLGVGVHFLPGFWRAVLCTTLGASVYLIMMLVLSRDTMALAFHTLWKLIVRTRKAEI